MRCPECRWGYKAEAHELGDVFLCDRCASCVTVDARGCARILRRLTELEWDALAPQSRAELTKEREKYAVAGARFRGDWRCVREPHEIVTCKEVTYVR